MYTLNPLWVGLFWLLSGSVLSARAELLPANPVLLPSTETPVLTEAIAPVAAFESTPTQEWMQQSLMTLAERHHCGAAAQQRLQLEQTATRYEMAALLFSCLETIRFQALNSEDKTVLQQLQTALQRELATLQGVGGGSELWQQPSVALPVEAAQPDLAGISAAVSFGNVEIFGRYGRPSEALFVPPTSQMPSVIPQPLDLKSAAMDQDIQTWSAGVGVRGVVIPKSRLTLTAQWSSHTTLKPFSGVSYGAFYQFPLRDRLMLSPSVVIMTNPTDPRTPTVQGAVQASFSF